MAKDNPQTLVSTDWLAARVSDPDIRVIDASYYLPAMGRDARAEYQAGHIPGAVFFDIDAVADPANPLPHMAAPPAVFAAHMHAMGVGDDHQVIIYDGAGLFSAARVWWNFRLMGKINVAVLDGGLPKWVAEGRDISRQAPAMFGAAPFTAHPNPALICDVAQVQTSVQASVQTGAAQIVDARSPARFAGAEPEPRPELRSGHIPAAKNVHYATLLNADGTMKDTPALKAVFDAAGVDTQTPIITTCGSGITAAIVMLALVRLGNSDVSLYDGSWAEWGQCAHLEVAKT
jgi:thiosulfate/3-mercaptopyruvate sulfurtransferase